MDADALPGPGLLPQGGIPARSPAVTSPPRRLQRARPRRETQAARRELRWLHAHGRKPGQGGPVATLMHQRCSRPGRPWGASTLLRCVGTVGSGLFLVSMWSVLSLHNCASLLGARAQRSTMGMGPSEPYLLFLKKSLIAFCNCTVDKCSKST